MYILKQHFYSVLGNQTKYIYIIGKCSTTELCHQLWLVLYIASTPHPRTCVCINHTHIHMQTKPTKQYSFSYGMETGKKVKEMLNYGQRQKVTYIFYSPSLHLIILGIGMEDNLSVLWKYWISPLKISTVPIYDIKYDSERWILFSSVHAIN